MKTLPAKALEYIREHHPEAQLGRVDRHTGSSNSSFLAEIIEDQQVVKLVFNHHGDLMLHSEEPRYNDELDDQLFYGKQ